MPFISALIGWFTSGIAIKMLFHPREPKQFLGITFQGVFPKRRKQFAAQVARLLSSELSFDEVEKTLSDPAKVDKLLPILETHIDVFLREKLTAQIPMLGMLIGDKTIGQVKAVFLKELEEIFPTLMKQYIATLQHDLNLENLIADKVSGLSLGKMEDMLQQILSPQFRLIKIMGAVLGFIIGVVQVLITIATT